MEEPDDYSQDSPIDGVITMVAPHATGHQRAKNGTLLRVDCERGIGWVATHYDLNLRVIQQVRGSDEDVHRAAASGHRARGPMRLHVVDVHRGIPATRPSRQTTGGSLGLRGSKAEK